MNGKQLGLSLVLAGFAGLTVWACEAYGLLGVIQLATANLATQTLFADLVIALSLVSIWMWQDARDRGVTVLPYLVLTLVAGSVGPLLYLIRREASAAGRMVHAAGVAR